MKLGGDLDGRISLAEVIRATGLNIPPDVVLEGGYQVPLGAAAEMGSE